MAKNIKIFLIDKFCIILGLTDYNLIIKYPFRFLKALKNIRDYLSPNENVLKFLCLTIFWQKKMRHKKYLNNIKNKNFETFNYNFLKESTKLNRPIIVIFWHQGSLNIDSMNKQVFPEGIVITTKELRKENFDKIEIDENNTPLSLLKVFEVLNNSNKQIVWGIDADTGRRNIKINVFKNNFLFSGGYGALTKILNPVIIPCTHYVSEDFMPRYYFHEPLFAPQELKNLSQQQILQRSVDFLAEDLKNKGKYQIDCFRYFRRLCADNNLN